MHNYVKKMQRLLRDGMISIEECGMINIFHDDWCQIYQKRECNCNPVIDYRAAKKSELMSRLAMEEELNKQGYHEVGLN